MMYQLKDGVWEDYVDDGSFENYSFSRRAEAILSKRHRVLEAEILLLRFETGCSVMVVYHYKRAEYMILGKSYQGTECLNSSLDTCWEVIDNHDAKKVGLRRKTEKTDPGEEL